MSEKPWVQLNFKTPAGSLINIYADDAAELDGGIEAVEERAGRIGELERLLGAVGAVNQAFPATPPQAAPQQPYVPQQRSYGNTQEGLPRPAGPAPFLPNGQEAQWKSGISKAGKAYGGWYDPSTKSFIR